MHAAGYVYISVGLSVNTTTQKTQAYGYIFVNFLEGQETID